MNSHFADSTHLIG